MSHSHSEYLNPYKHMYPPCRALPPGQNPHPNPNFMQEALLTSDPLTFLPESPKDYVILKKIDEISEPYQKRIRSTCYIPERNLFLVLPVNSWIILIYSTINNFKLIAQRSSSIEPNAEPNIICYSKALDRILIGGRFIEIWDPIYFQLQGRSLEISQQVYSLVYLPTPGLFAAKTLSAIYVYSRDLKLKTRFQLPPNGCVKSSTAEIFDISQDLLLAVCHFGQSRTFLLDLKNETIKEFDQIETPSDSCVGVIQETPNKVFTCLVSGTKFFSPSWDRLNPYKLIQFTVDLKTKELIISRVTKTEHSFNRLWRLENSRYFLTEGYNPSNLSKFFLLSIEKDQVEVIKITSDLEKPTGSFTMIEKNSLIIHTNGPALCLYKYKIPRKDKRSSSQEGDLHPQNPNLSGSQKCIAPLLFLPESLSDSVSFKNFGKILVSSRMSIISTCYIPQRNLLFVLPSNSRTILIYRNFKLIAERTVGIELNIISYSKDLDKILGGGCLIKIWNPIDFKLEAQSPSFSQDNERAESLVYLPKPNVVVVKTISAFYVYSRDLALLTRFELPSNYCTFSLTAEFVYVSQGLLLAVHHSPKSKTLLLDLKNETVKEFDQIDIPSTSCVGVIQETPNKIFICLTSGAKSFFSSQNPQGPPYKLIQFTIDPKTKELEILRVIKEKQSFSRLLCLEGSKYFLAERNNPRENSEIFLLLISKYQVETIQVISDFSNLIGNFMMMKNGSLMMNYKKDYGLYLYKCKIKRKNKKLLNQQMDPEESCLP